MEINRIYCEDCIETLKRMPNEFFQCVITSPPYWGLRDYGTGKWEGGDENCNHARDTKLGKHNITGHQNNPIVGDAIYKDICKKCGAIRIDKQLGLEKTPEEYVGKLVVIFSEIKRVLKKDGTVWINLGDSYAGNHETYRGKEPKWQHIKRSERIQAGRTLTGKGLKNGDLCGIPWSVAFALRADGWWLRSDIIWHKPNPIPESVKNRPTKSHEYVFLLTKSKKYYYDHAAIKEPLKENSITRSLYGWNGCVVGDRRIRSSPEKTDKMGERWFPVDGRNKRSVWTIPTKSYKEAHFATYPPDLIKPCVLAGSREGDIIYDPFMGAGTTALVALHYGRQFIGSELNQKYVEMANQRIYPFINQKIINYGKKTDSN